MIKLKAFSSDTHYAFLMLKVDDDLTIRNIRRNISYEDIYEPDNEDYGIETTPHITIFSCMDNSTRAAELSDYLLPSQELRIEGNGLDVFENDKYDVLILRVNSDDLSKMNSEISNTIKSYSEYKDYNPHLTIAYLKKGTGKNYLESINDIILTPEYYFMSYYIGDERKEYKFNK